MRNMNLRAYQTNTRGYFEVLENSRRLGRWSRFVILIRLEEEISEITRIMFIDELIKNCWKADNIDYIDEFGDAFVQLAHLANESCAVLEESWKNIMWEYARYACGEKE